MYLFGRGSGGLSKRNYERRDFNATVGNPFGVATEIAQNAIVKWLLSQTFHSHRNYGIFTATAL